LDLILAEGGTFRCLQHPLQQEDDTGLVQSDQSDTIDIKTDNRHPYLVNIYGIPVSASRGSLLKRSVFSGLMVVLIYRLFAAPINDARFDFLQPDGSKVPVVVSGDEYYQHVETPDGFTLVRDSITGWICYADLSSDSSRLTASSRVYRGGTLSDSTPDHRRHIRRSRQARLKRHAEVMATFLASNRPDVLPLADGSGSGFRQEDSSSDGIRSLAGVTAVTGTFLGLTVCIDFSDEPASLPKDSIDAMINGKGYTGYRNNGSVHDYYYDVSGGKVEYTNIVMGYYRAKKTKAYYDNGMASFGVRAQELILEALQWVDNEGFDYSQLSENDRKRVLAVNFMYAGIPTQGWSEGLWPHQGNLSAFSADGVSVRRYQITNIGQALKIGAFCHENGHMLFSWPDLYDYGGESAGMGDYCIMCNTNELNPASPCAYLRDLSGWDAVTDITGYAKGTLLTCLPNSNTSFVYRNTANANEMFYLEGRRRAGRSKTLPDSGFVILHVDRAGSNDNEASTATSHYQVALVQADGKRELERGVNGGNRGDLFRAGYRDRFSDTTTPDAHWWNGKVSGLDIRNMSGVGDTMSLSIGEIPGTVYTITASATAHGTIIPSGKVSVTSGGSLSFVIKPDSGYQIDMLTIDGVQSTIKDTLALTNVSAGHTIDVTFGLTSALSVLTPHEYDVLYAGDSLEITWRVRGVTMKGVVLSMSTDGGKSWNALGERTAADSSFLWVVSSVESDSCRIKIADTDGSPESVTGLFAIRKKPSINLASPMLRLDVEQGRKKSVELSIGDDGMGTLSLSLTTAQAQNRVLISELSVGLDADAPDAVELTNVGNDIDFSGYELVWEDNKSTSGSYRFPDGFVFRGKSTFLVHDNATLVNDSSAYAGLPLQWNYGDALELAVTLFDPAGRGIDFVKTSGSADLPPEGTLWHGDGIVLCSAFVYRPQLMDSDSAIDWQCTAKGTLNAIPGGVTAVREPVLLTVSPLRTEVQPRTTGTVTLTLDAASCPVGSYADMLVIYHNVPDTLSPVRIPCMISVVEPSAVRRAPSQREKRPVHVFAAAPNPVHAGHAVTVQYCPSGDEVRAVLQILGSTGSVLRDTRYDMSRISVFRREPVSVIWTPSLRFAGTTVLARVTVLRKNGVRDVFTQPIAIE